jgi:EmrB/QacA subfamily drug resistance transporter
MATILIAAIEGTIVATVMPAIVGKLGGFDLLSWAFTAYLLTQAVTIPIYGRLADLFGRKRVLLTAIALFLVGSVLCGFAWSMPSLIGFRALQGIGAGGLVPIAQTIIGDVFTPAERARIQGWLSSIWAVGAIVGPLLGAFLVRYTIWPMVFWVNVPIGAVAGVMLMLTLREQLQQRRHRIDYLGSLLMMLATSTLMFALVDAATLPVAVFVMLVAGAIILLALFVLHERRTPEPMLPLSLWRNPIIAGGNISFLALGAVLIGSTAFLSLYVQGVMGRSATVAGFALGAPSVSWPIGSMLGGRLMLHASYRAAVFAGTVPFIAGSLMMIAIRPVARCGRRAERR